MATWLWRWQPCAEGDVGSDVAVGPDDGTGGDVGAGFDDGGGVEAVGGVRCEGDEFHMFTIVEGKDPPVESISSAVKTHTPAAQRIRRRRASA